MGIKRGGVGLSGSRATNNGERGKDAEMSGTGGGEKNKDVDVSGTGEGEEKAKAKSNTDFKAMFLKKDGA